MRPAPFAADDADVMLADQGVQVICAAVPSVTRALYDYARASDEVGEGRVARELHVLKVKANAFGASRVKDLRLTIVDATGASFDFSIDHAMDHGPSLFDAYVLQPVRTRASA